MDFGSLPVPELLITMARAMDCVDHEMAASLFYMKDCAVTFNMTGTFSSFKAFNL